MIPRLSATLLATVVSVCIVEASTVSSSLAHSYQDDNSKAILGNTDSVTLTSNGKTPGILIIDYHQNVDGFPTFEVVKTKGNTSVFELTYGETKAAVNQYMGDGPMSFAAAMDNYRINRHNITGPSVISQRLIQGGFRYQKLNLSSAGTLVLKNIGVKPTTDTTPLDKLAAYFECSDKDLTRIWRTGARTVQLTEIPKNSLPDFWNITKEGALVESSAPQILAQAESLTDYKLQFQVKPLTGQFGFLVLGDSLNTGIYISCNLLDGTVSVHVGSTNLDKVIKTTKLSTRLPINKWLTVAATVNSTQIQVSFNGKAGLDFTQAEKFAGSVGLGADYPHAAVFRNLNLTTLTGGDIYSASLKDDSFLDDFLMGTNPADTIVDGSRRDRIAYSGDLDIALAASFASTYARSFVEGTIDLLGSFQTTSGFFIPTAKIQQPPLASPLPFNMTGLIGYSFNIMTAMAYNYEMTGDVAFAKKWAPAVISMLDWVHSQSRGGLFSLSDESFGGDWNYYDPPQSGIVTKFNAVYAYALAQCIPMLDAAGKDVSVYSKQLKTLRTAMNDKLWDESMGAYVLSEKHRDGFAQDANAIAILAGVPSGKASSSRILSTMKKELMLPAGPLAFSNSTSAAGFARKISPYASTYHLRAAFQSNNTEIAKSLLKTLWAPMADPKHTNYTNCFWETLNPEGTPGLALGTSLCHGWGAGPTAELIRHVLGIQPVEAGFRKWTVVPQTLGLKWAKGKQPTPHGDISVEWKFDNKLLHMEVRGPRKGSQGTVFFPQPLLTPLSKTVITVNGKIIDEPSFKVQPNEKLIIEQRKR
ncbi:Six-hairpin glycosidase-like protein [Fusarium oxysporum Fo47]|uniref:Six-hairpin glycosidase-like protein n=1 Tax=Fusarium oxysporum Fo47 TaxID=660027 RepID=UPI00159A056F|nr:Six-hairpin glycosidase-like protein [Fusarium oxysporum Fo47]QKD56927.1 Six-hairpin glycosidase-like protein [Fusarium oxysporum Fo47]